MEQLNLILWFLILVVFSAPQEISLISSDPSLNGPYLYCNAGTWSSEKCPCPLQGCWN